MEAYGFLFINPSAMTSPEPVIDELTKKMTAAFRASEVSNYAYRGFHVCHCGARSTNVDYFLSNGMMTNSLCVHYLAWHREEVPQGELNTVSTFEHGLAEPNEDELSSPTLKRIDEDFLRREAERIEALERRSR